MKTLVACLAILGLMAGLAFAQSGAVPAAGAESTQSVISVSRMLEECGVFEWPLLLTLIIGVLISIYQLAILLLENRRTAPLRRTAFHLVRTDEIETQLKSSAGATEMGQTLQLLFRLSSNGNEPDDLYHNEITHAATVRKDRFQTYRTWMTYLSDAAGAFGLLGTVVGMYMTFFGGTLDNAKILAGMAIALSTTIVGLINSLILTLISTSLSHIFDRQLELTYEKAEELRFAMKVKALPSTPHEKPVIR